MPSISVSGINFVEMDMKKVVKKNPYAVPIVILLVCLVGLVFMWILCRHGFYLGRRSVIVNNGGVEPTENLTAGLLKNPEKMWHESDGVTIGAQYDGYLENHYLYTELTDWTISLLVDGKARIDASPWNGKFELSGESLRIVEPCKGDVIGGIEFTEDYTVPPKGKRTFGCIMYTGRFYNSAMSDLKIEYRPHVLVRQMPHAWGVLILFGSGLISMLSVIITTMFKKKESDRQKLTNQQFIESTLLVFANTIEAKDSYTRGHSQRVALYARELAARMGFDADFQENVYYCALIHDVGKIGIPDEILHKPGRLTDEERKVIQSHASIGGDIFKDFSYIPGISEAVRHHHERYDGGGYPDGLSGESIPLLARIICVADCFDAMTSNRCYRNKIDIERVVADFKENSGKQFDPDIVPHMLSMIAEGKAPLPQ